MCLSNVRDSSSAWKNVRENIKISAEERLGHHKQKHHKPWFYYSSKLVDHRKQDKLQLFQNASQINTDHLNNVRHETSRYFKNK